MSRQSSEGSMLRADGDPRIRLPAETEAANSLQAVQEMTSALELKVDKLIEDAAITREHADAFAKVLDTANRRLDAAEAQQERLALQVGKAHADEAVSELEVQDEKPGQSWPRKSPRHEDSAEETSRLPTRHLNTPQEAKPQAERSEVKRLTLRKPPPPEETEKPQVDEDSLDAWQAMGSQGYVMQRIEAFGKSAEQSRIPGKVKGSFLRVDSSELSGGASASEKGGSPRAESPGNPQKAGSSESATQNSARGRETSELRDLCKQAAEAVTILRREHRREAAALWDGLADLAEHVGVDGARFISVEPSPPKRAPTAALPSTPLAASAGPAAWPGPGGDAEQDVTETRPDGDPVSGARSSEAAAVLESSRILAQKLAASVEGVQDGELPDAARTLPLETQLLSAVECHSVSGQSVSSDAVPEVASSQEQLREELSRVIAAEEMVALPTQSLGDAYASRLPIHIPQFERPPSDQDDAEVRTTTTISVSMSPRSSIAALDRPDREQSPTRERSPSQE
eukprot:TRINITY_DN4813_c0_g1_i2.p1 TRINITY_DN4813_c0_g1~~TRINITY_DN4813_c0_g1_i2.p1  ORF type:complete len:514 (-),score=130.96 TRINITY_DN4813_c0_g1_i2:8-1549(-)